MKYSAIVHLFQLVVVLVFLTIFKQLGYILAMSFANPSIYTFFMLPLSIISFVFVLTYVIAAKKAVMNIFERIIALVISMILSLIIAFGTWIYILIPTNLQITIYTISFLLVSFELLWVTLNKKIKTIFARIKNNHN